MNLEQVKERIKIDYGVEFEDMGNTLETPYMFDTCKGIAIFKKDNRIIAFGLNSSQDTTFTRRKSDVRIDKYTRLTF